MREKILEQLWAEQDKAFDLMVEYDSMPHFYGTDVLYQAEAYTVRVIGDNPGTTNAEVAEKLKKTPSACSQIIRKLIDKGLVSQIRNEHNKRIYNLTLTEDGERVYKDHIDFNKICQEKTFELLREFTDEELSIHTKVQKIINKAYQLDVCRTKERYG